MSIFRKPIFLIVTAGLVIAGCRPTSMIVGKSNFSATECVEMANLPTQQFFVPPAMVFIGPLVFIKPVSSPPAILEIVDGNSDGANELFVPDSAGAPPMTMLLTNSANGGFKRVLVILELGAVPAELRGFDSSGTQIVMDKVDESPAELILEGNGDIISYVEFHMFEALIQQICW